MANAPFDLYIFAFVCGTVAGCYIALLIGTCRDRRRDKPWPRDKKWQKKARREAWAPEKENWRLDAEEHGWRPPTGPTHRTASGQVLRMPPWQPPRNPRPPGPEAPTPQCPPAPLPSSPPPAPPRQTHSYATPPVTYYRVED